MGTSIQGKFWQLHLQEGMRVGGRVNCKRHPMGVGVIAGELEGKNWPGGVGLHQRLSGD